MTAAREYLPTEPPCNIPLYNGLGEEGCYYYNARWYDASTGRFISEDPARDGANWYVYVSNNPLKFIDPTGLLKFFLGGEAEIATPFGGFDVGASVVVDANDPAGEDSDLYVSGGVAVGASAGAAVGGGVIFRDADGATPLSTDLNYKKLSVTFLTDDIGFNGFSINIGKGAGFAVSSTKTKNTGFVSKAANWLTDKLYDFLTSHGKPLKMDIPSDIEQLSGNVDDILNGEKSPSEIQDGVQNPVSMRNNNPSQPTTKSSSQDRDESNKNQNQNGSDSNNDDKDRNDPQKDKEPEVKKDGHGNTAGL